MNKIWLIGSGPMAQDYIKVLRALEAPLEVIGRGEESAQKCEAATGCTVIRNGLEAYLQNQPAPATHAIVSVGVEALMVTTVRLLDYGVRAILIEKPAGMNAAQVAQIAERCRANDAKVFVAYNRRYYGSVLQAQKIIADDGGITSFNFEFTEWAHVIGTLKKADGVLERWFLANSTHVVDLAFHLGGKPQQLATYTSGTLDWHPAASVFAGAGVSESGALFSYQANWESAGRWSVEVLTRQHRLILRPMEKLQIQKRGSVAVEFVDCDLSLDEQFKPGLYLQTRHFLDGEHPGLCSIDYQSDMMDTYCKIAGYPI